MVIFYIHYLHGVKHSLRNNLRHLQDCKSMWITSHMNNNYNILFKLSIMNSITSTNTIIKKKSNKSQIKSDTVFLESRKNLFFGDRGF